MKLEVVAGFYVRSPHPESLAQWYAETFSGKVIPVTNEMEGTLAAVSLEREGEPICIGLDGEGEGTPMLYARGVEKAHGWLMERGVNVGPVQQDRQGNTFFEMRDPADNIIEVTREL